MKWRGNGEIMLKCVVKDCNCEADYVLYGMSLCEGHLERKRQPGTENVEAHALAVRHFVIEHIEKGKFCFDK